MAPIVLMVAEKPSIAEAIAKAFSNGNMSSHRNGACPVHEFTAVFNPAGSSLFRVTSVMGHVYSTDFPGTYNNWQSHEPVTLFKAPTEKKEANPKARVCKHLQQQGKGADYLVLWLDCDKEGENICFEVIENVEKTMNRRQSQQIFRAKFSAITPNDLKEAMRRLGQPNKLESLSVDARQILDLKVGVAFTRFQTLFFQGKYGDLDSRLISYGPCQTPTLGFTVQRHDEIQMFKPETFWRLVPKIEKEGQILHLEWGRDRVFDQEVAIAFHRLLSGTTKAVVQSVKVSDEKLTRPQGLNTVEMLKAASSKLGIGPHQCMNIAERLYTSGYISYPRTESTAYTGAFNVREVVASQRNHPNWGHYVERLLGGEMTKPRAGHDAGDHPPITPTRMATESELGGDTWVIYDLVVRHFLATVSPDCVFTRTKIVVDIGGEVFTCTGRRLKFAGFTEVQGRSVDDEYAPPVSTGEHLSVISIDIKDGRTSAPDYLTESELIGLMEKHGIGTDASIPSHINNICERNYAKVQGNKRMIVPTQLGITLVHGYYKIDPELVMPTMRASMEKELDLISKGQLQYSQVLSHCLDIFERKFVYFANNVNRMDSLFETSFSTLASTGKPFSRCGKCGRFMKLVQKKPQRLFCPTCDDTYALPQNGSVKLNQELKCPVDGFELLICSIGAKGKEYSFSPYLYSNPPFPGIAAPMGCNQCVHPTCKHSLMKNRICSCPEDGCDGDVVFIPLSKPIWRAACNQCTFLLMLPQNAHKIKISSEDCEECGSALLDITFHKDRSPLKNGEVQLTGCIQCHEVMYSLVFETHARRSAPINKNKFKKKGRGRKKQHVDPLMTFDGF